ncbi:hypothetical protein C1I97_36935 [Streptomyces sp. NTH33]|nr:hypothetical protein C1I97_36935 [Streptomyces sp. NTH33]
MTPEQVLIISAIGGCAALLGLIVIAALAGLIYLATGFLQRAFRALRRHRVTRDDDLSVCLAIDALPTTDHPKEDLR